MARLMVRGGTVVGHAPRSAGHMRGAVGCHLARDRVRVRVRVRVRARGGLPSACRLRRGWSLDSSLPPPSLAPPLQAARGGKADRNHRPSVQARRARVTGGRAASEGGDRPVSGTDACTGSCTHAALKARMGPLCAPAGPKPQWLHRGAGRSGPPGPRGGGPRRSSQSEAGLTTEAAWRVPSVAFRIPTRCVTGSHGPGTRSA